jgi:prevent-host-death family protein
MSMKALPIGEARRRLPELVRRVAGGHGSVTIGRGGRPEVMLVPAGTPARGVARRPLVGLVEIVENEDDIERGQKELRGVIEASLKRTASLIGGESKARRAKPRRS